MKKPNLLEVLDVKLKEDDDENGFIGEHYIVRCLLSCPDTSIPIDNSMGRKESTCLVDRYEFHKWINKNEKSIIWI